MLAIHACTAACHRCPALPGLQLERQAQELAEAAAATAQLEAQLQEQRQQAAAGDCQEKEEQEERAAAAAEAIAGLKQQLQEAHKQTAKVGSCQGSSSMHASCGWGHLQRHRFSQWEATTEQGYHSADCCH